MAVYVLITHILKWGQCLHKILPIKNMEVSHHRNTQLIWPIMTFEFWVIDVWHYQIHFETFWPVNYWKTCNIWAISVLPLQQDHGQTTVNCGLTMVDHGHWPWSAMIWPSFDNGLTMVDHVRYMERWSWPWSNSESHTLVNDGHSRTKLPSIDHELTISLTMVKPCLVKHSYLISWLSGGPLQHDDVQTR